MSTANGIFATDAMSNPYIAQTIPSGVQANITQVGTISSGVWNGSPITTIGSLTSGSIALPGFAIIGQTTNTAISSGRLGEQIRSTVAKASAISLTSGNAANIASISLTAGVWDVSAIVSFTGGLTLAGPQFISINTTSATLGTLGDNAISTVLSLLTLGQDNSASIPSYRISISSTTTVYLVAQTTFTLGTSTAYGRVSATRVA